MKAAVLEQFGSPLVFRSVPDPVPAPGEVLVEVHAVGICGTDLKIHSGTFSLDLPRIPGHEVAGCIVATGPDVEEQRLGERVACYYYKTCQTCFWCTHDQENLCDNVLRLGFERDGGMAQLVVVGAAEAIPIPDGVSYEAAAAAMDAVTTPWRALRQRLRLNAGETVAVVGAGGLGLHAVQVAKHMGARVGVIEPSPERRQSALADGAEIAFAPSEAHDLLDWAQHKIDVVLEISGTASGLETAVSLVRNGGRIGVIGYRPGSELRMATPQLVLGEVEIIGCRGGSIEDAAAALEAIASGAVTVHIADTLALADANAGLDAISTGAGVGRIILHPDHSREDP